MLKHAGALARELFQDNLFGPAPSQRNERRVEAVGPIREKRDSGTQELSFGARPFILCGLPIRRLPDGTLTYTRRNGRFFLEIVGHPEFGVPFGQDRLVLLWLATEAVRQRSPVVEFESAAQILNKWGLPTNGEYYRRLAASFKRVFASTIFFGTRDDRRGSEAWDRSRAHFFDHVQLWCSKESCAAPGRRGNLVTLSTSFWEELRAHPIPVDTEVVRVLANNPGCLDLYTWLTWRCYQAKTAERIPLFGPFGLAAQLGVQEYARERKFRERISRWLKIVHVYWPECPAIVSHDRRFLELTHRRAITDQGENGDDRKY
jgi:hypothetical protein